MPIAQTNPANGQVLKTFESLSDAVVQKKLETAQRAFMLWRNRPFPERATLFKKLATLLREQQETLGAIATKEMGKPITQAKAELEKCAWACDFFADNAETFLRPEIIETDASKSYVTFNPLGVVFAVMPWNFPFWQVLRFAAPTLMAGNVGVLKHASNVPETALKIEELFLQAGFPEGVFQTLLIESGAVASVIADERVQAVTLTGSEYAGSEVAAQAGKLIKKTVLELGGSDPFIVLSDADVDQAATIAAKARIQNNGQSCIAAKRFIVTSDIAEQFTEKFKVAMEKLVIGDPANADTEIGPVVSQKALEGLLDQVNRSVAMGATLITGGTQLERSGSFLAPTILTNVTKGMPAYEEEMFGPVAAVIIVKDAEEAVAVANSSRFGLGASVWTADIELAERMAAQIESGSVFVNGMVKSDPRLPFGGIKKSGYGRELSHYTIKEFVNIKTVWIQ